MPQTAACSRPTVGEHLKIYAEAMLDKMEGALVKAGESVRACGFYGRFPLNHRIKCCRNISLHFQDESEQERFQEPLLKYCTDKIKQTAEEPTLILTFESVDSITIPDDVFFQCGYRLLDSSFEYGGPVPYAKSPEYAYKRTHKDAIHRYDASQEHLLPAIIDLHNRIYKDMLPIPKRNADTFGSLLKEDGNYLAYSQNEQGAITGMVEVCVDADKKAYVADILVSFRRMGTGLAIELGRLSEAFAREAGAKEVSCHVADKNRASRQLIESFGFTRKRAVKRFVQEAGPTASQA